MIVKQVFWFFIVLFFISGTLFCAAQENKSLIILDSYPEPEKLTAVERIIPKPLYRQEMPEGRIQPQILKFDFYSCFCFSPDGRYLARDLGPSVGIYDALNGQLVKTIPTLFNDVTGLAFSREGTELILAGSSSYIYSVDIESGKIVREFFREYDSFWDVLLSPDGKLLVGQASHLFDDFHSDTITVWDYYSGEELWSEAFSEIGLFSFNSSSDNLLLALRDYYSLDITLQKHDAYTGELLLKQTCDRDQFSGSGWAPAVYYQPLSDSVIYSHEDFGMGFLNDSLSEALLMFYSLKNSEHFYGPGPVLSNNGNTLAIVKKDQLLIFNGECYQHMTAIPIEESEKYYHYEMALDPLGEKLYLNAEDPFIYNIQNSSKILLNTASGCKIMDITWSESGEEFYCVSEKYGRIFIDTWENPQDINNCSVTNTITLQKYAEGYYKLIHGQEGILLAEWGINPNNIDISELNIRDVETGGVLLNLRPCPSWANMNIFPDGKRLLIYDLSEIGWLKYELTLFIIDLEKGTVIKEVVLDVQKNQLPEGGTPYRLFYLGDSYITGANTVVLGLCESDCGSFWYYTLVWDTDEAFSFENSLNEDININQWRLKDKLGTDTHVLYQNDSMYPFNRIFFSGDNEYLVKCWEKYILNEETDTLGMISVYDTITGSLEYHLPGHTQWLLCSALSSGNILATAGEDSSLMFWDIETGKLLNTIYIIDNNEYFCFDSSGIIKTNSSRLNLFPVVEEAKIGEALFYPDRALFTGIVNGNGLRVRTLPLLSADVRGTLNTGERVSVLRISQETTQIDDKNGYWYLIVSGSGLRGWVYGYYVDPE
jgi:WD40 repeat protein